ncbi:MAG: polysaccharide deacetylase family protein [Oscillospiraceae bacterium]|nr:polysaccharide deacetylase family protein [Oscillospiraceae bacterium]
MRAVTFTKGQIKRLAVIAAAVVATAAVGITVAVNSVGTKAQQRLVPIYSVDRNDNKIAVTFDVAWENSNTAELLSILDEYDAKATFFVTGDFCDRHPKDVERFYAAGHEIGNHSDAHPHVAEIAVNDLINDTRECSRKIKMLTGEEPTLYRAPYGEYSDNMLTTIDGMGLKTIQWDADSIDWDGASVEDIEKRIIKNTKSGSILLFHNDLENTTMALPAILKQLKQSGYEFVTVSELIYPDNYTIDPNGVQKATKASIFEDEKIEAVIAQYSNQIEAAGITDEEIAQAVSAIKSGDLSKIPERLRPFAQQVINNLDNVEINPDSSNGNNSDNSEPIKK